MTGRFNPLTQIPVFVLPFFQFAGSSSSPGALVEDTATVSRQCSRWRVSQQANQSVLGMASVMPAEGFYKVAARPEGLWGYNTERTRRKQAWRRADLVPDPEPLDPAAPEGRPGLSFPSYRRLGGCDDSVLCVVLAGSTMPVIRLNTRLGVSMKVYYKWNQHLQSTDLFIHAVCAMDMWDLSSLTRDQITPPVLGACGPTTGLARKSPFGFKLRRSP